MSTEQVVIIGAGDCGTRAALRLRELDGDQSIILIGEESVDPYERPALSKTVLVDEDEAPRPITDRKGLAAADIIWHSGATAVRVDADIRQVELADGSFIGYDRLLIATGARARRLPLPGAGTVAAPDDAIPVHMVRSVADAVRLRQQLQPGARVLVIGGGFVGLETAASARRRGADVTVIEFAHTLMSRVVPAPVARIIEQRHRAEGVDLRTGVSVAELTAAKSGVKARLDDGTRIVADVVVAGVGAIPNVELAATAGLAIDNGIAVDANLRTSDPNIFAAGDCCSVPHPIYDGRRIRLEAWLNALAQSDVAAANLARPAGSESVVFEAVPSFWSDQYDLTMYAVGLHGAAVADVVRRRDDGYDIHVGIGQYGRIVSASGVAPGTTLAREMRMLERLIEARVAPEVTDLSDHDVDLRSLLP